MKEPSILITGGNGYVGVNLAEALLQEGQCAVQLYLHAVDQAEFESKAEPLRERFAPYVNAGQLLLIGGELSDDLPLSSVSAAGIKQIVHSAAVTRFNVDAELANKVNVLGSKHVLEFARRCENLESIQFLSTIYAAGLRTGPVAEERLETSTFSNHYERSKWESEELLFTKFADLPFNLIRIATLISDNAVGTVSQQNAFHNTLKLFYYGLLSIFPGEKTCPVYFVTGDFVISSLRSIMHSTAIAKVFHICHRDFETARLEQLVDTVFDTFEKYPDFKTRRVLRPLWSDVESFELLQEGIGELSNGVMSQAISSVAPFARQLFAPKQFCNDNLRSLLPSYEAEDPLLLISNAAKYLADTKWGRSLKYAQCG